MPLLYAFLITSSEQNLSQYFTRWPGHETDCTLIMIIIIHLEHACPSHNNSFKLGTATKNFKYWSMYQLGGEHNEFLKQTKHNILHQRCQLVTEFEAWRTTARDLSVYRRVQQRERESARVTMTILYQQAKSETHRVLCYKQSSP